MEDCKPFPSPFDSRAKLSMTCSSLEVDATLYSQLVGKKLYLTHTLPDLSLVVSLTFPLLLALLLGSCKTHMKVIGKQLKEYFVKFENSSASCVVTLSLGPITWACKEKIFISLSSTEAKYRGVVEASKEAMWLCQILSVFGFQQQHLTTLWCDNQSAIQLCKDRVQHQRNKHIELHMQFIKKLTHGHVLEVQYCSIDDQVANIFTKALTEVKFTKIRFMVRVLEVVTKGGIGSNASFLLLLCHICTSFNPIPCSS
eukprot:PITA_26231